MKTAPVIRMRPPRKEDALATVKWRNHPIVREHFSGHGQEVSLSDEQVWMERQAVPVNDSRTYCIEDPASGMLVGMTFLKHIDQRHRQAEFAILIDPDKSGQGYGTAACRATLREAFGALALHRVYLKVRTDNQPAIRLYDLCGFAREGVLRDDHFKHGRFYDQYIMSILSTDA